MLCKTVFTTVVIGSLTVLSAGCTSVLPGAEQPTGLAADVAAKAEEIALGIGGAHGFGGAYMDGYYNHMALHMGFHNESYLADPDENLIVELTNEGQVSCTFYLAYVQSGFGLEEQIETIVVEPGETLEVELPCAEFVGAGSLTDVGAIAVEISGGSGLDNRFCVPGFLNSDYVCGGTYACILGPDTNDLDLDGDTEELIVVTSGLLDHMRREGMGSHMWDDDYGFGGMMGGWGPMMGGPNSR